MNIQPKVDMTKWIDVTLDEINYRSPPDVTQKCCHCGLVMRFPLIARQTDIDLFNDLITSAYKVMRKHGITAHLLADIQAQCHIEIAKKKAQK